MARWIVPQSVGGGARVLVGGGVNQADVVAEIDGGTSDVRAAAPVRADGVVDRIVKYVPAEIVAAYTLLFTALVGIGQTREHPERVTLGLMTAFFLATIVYVARNTAGEIRWAHLTVSPIAFLAWAYPISSALLGNWFDPLIAFAAQALVIVLSIFVVPKAK